MTRDKTFTESLSERSAALLESQSLAEKVIHWLTSHPLDETFLQRHLRHARFDQDVAQSLSPHYAKIAEVMNDAVIGSLYSSYQRIGEVPTRRQFINRLQKAQDALPERLREQIPDITDAQIAMVATLHDDWRSRVLHYTRHLQQAAQKAAAGPQR